MKGNIISDNTAEFGAGLFLFLDSSAKVGENLFENNHATSKGGALWVYNHSALELNNPDVKFSTCILQIKQPINETKLYARLKNTTSASALLFFVVVEVIGLVVAINVVANSTPTGISGQTC